MHDPERAQPHHHSAADESTRPQPRLDVLTPRQRAIAQLIARGHTDDEIGGELALDRTLVAEETEDIRAELGVQRRVQIAVVVTVESMQAPSPPRGMLA